MVYGQRRSIPGVCFMSSHRRDSQYNEIALISPSARPECKMQSDSECAVKAMQVNFALVMGTLKPWRIRKVEQLDD